jgi:hypothetical protein
MNRLCVLGVVCLLVNLWNRGHGQSSFTLQNDRHKITIDASNANNIHANVDLSHGSTFQVPIYYINMDKHVARRKAMESHLSALNVQYHKRIEALTIDTCNLIMIESPCLRVNFLDIAIMCSHLQALYTALNDPHPLAVQSDYVLVLEDDVRFLWAIDFDALIDKAPPNFGSLQLMLSHRPHVEDTWERFIETEGEELFVFRPRNSSVWSAQSILYRKSAIRSFVQAAVSKDRNGKLGFKMVNSFQYDKLVERTQSPNEEKLIINPFRPVVACECLFADMFLFAMARPSFITAIPLLNSAAQGMKSTIHQDHVSFHIHGFLATELYFTKMIAQLREELSEAIKQQSSRAGAGVSLKQLASELVHRVLPAAGHSHQESPVSHKARPPFLVHPLLPASVLLDASLMTYQEEDFLGKLSAAVQQELDAHLMRVLLPRNTTSKLNEIDAAVYYNLTQWQLEATAHPVEAWVFARIYGDAKKSDIDPHLFQYLRPDMPDNKHAHRHHGPTNA